MNTTMITSLTATITSFVRADSRTPTTSSAEIPTMIAMAGRLTSAPVACQARAAGVIGKSRFGISLGGTTMPKPFRKLTT